MENTHKFKNLRIKLGSRLTNLLKCLNLYFIFHICIIKIYNKLNYFFIFENAKANQHSHGG
jgi:hypothetical protein